MSDPQTRLGVNMGIGRWVGGGGGGGGGGTRGSHKWRHNLFY